MQLSSIFLSVLSSVVTHLCADAPHPLRTAKILQLVSLRTTAPASTPKTSLACSASAAFRDEHLLAYRLAALLVGRSPARPALTRIPRMTADLP